MDNTLEYRENLKKKIGYFFIHSNNEAIECLYKHMHTHNMIIITIIT